MEPDELELELLALDAEEQKYQERWETAISTAAELHDTLVKIRGVKDELLGLLRDHDHGRL